MTALHIRYSKYKPFVTVTSICKWNKVENKTSPNQVKYYRPKEKVGKRQTDTDGWTEEQIDGQTDTDRQRQDKTGIWVKKNQLSVATISLRHLDVGSVAPT